jgi:hypothetical protein
MHLHPSCRHASNEKRRNVFALRTDLRQMALAVGAGAVTICALSYECKKQKEGSRTPTDA